MTRRSTDRVLLAREIERAIWGLTELPPPGDLSVRLFLDRWADMPTDRLAAWRDRITKLAAGDKLDIRAPAVWREK